MTIHITWLGALAFIGAGALLCVILYVLYGAFMLWLFTRGMK